MKKYEVVIEYIEKGIQTGNLRPGEYLPSIRVMAQTLGFSTVTVYEAYCRLESLGVIISNVRRGFMLTDNSLRLDKECLSSDPNQYPPYYSQIQAEHAFVLTTKKPDMVQLGAMMPRNHYFPDDELAKCLIRAIKDNPFELNVHDFSFVLAKSVDAVAKLTARYMYTISGITVPESEIIMTNGATEGLLYTLTAIAKPGDVVITESPSYLGLFNILEQLNITCVEVETTTPYGLNVDKLEMLLESGLSPTCIVVTPNYQNPTGALMPLESRVRLIHLCKKHGVIIIEDDVLGSLGFEQMIPTLKSMEPEDVIYVSSYTKVFAPGYRVGWVAGGKWTSEIDITKKTQPYGMSKFGRLAIAQYLETAKINPYLLNLRKIYKRNSEIMMNAIKQTFPEECEMAKPLGGQYLWVKMPEPVSSMGLFMEAQKESILLAPGGMFTMTGKYDGFLRFCYALDLDQKTLDAIEIVGTMAKTRIDQQSKKRKAV